MSKCFSVLFVLMTAGLTAQGGDISGKVTAGKGASVVYVEAVAGKTFPAPAKPLDMDQKSLTFRPHLLIAPVGATVEFLNSDNVAHNIFWPAISNNKKLGHNLGTWPQGEKRAFKFDTPGIVPLLCNVHPEMSGYVIVTPTPYYAETDATGSFKIAGVPDGSYTLTAWHEGFKTQSKPLMVSGDTKADFTLSK
ncbi:MAG TPA: carboxypeptidase regulatory-like domain-containing protein [Bryobacteraceae bacterium]|nr:carboxypeptidase regulatory-like domain-containing protein [Bryobacteraceae bacterium]